MTATPQVLDFRHVEDQPQAPSGVLGAKSTKLPLDHQGYSNVPRTPEGKVLTDRQIRARMRRRARRTQLISTEEFNILYKPIEEWDLDELAHGRPRNKKGNFTGKSPAWVNREVHERSMDRFKAAIRTKMNGETPTAIDAIQWILGNDNVDDKGKPVVSASTKLDAAKFLLEHVVGKPTQRIESDVSVKLQAILGTVMVNPEQALMGRDGNAPAYSLGHLPGVTMPMASAADADNATWDDDGDWVDSDG